MRRSALALSGSFILLLALAVPVFADWPGDPGTYKNFGVTHVECLDVDCNPNFNERTVMADINPDGTAEICLRVSTPTTFEVGCVSVSKSVLLTRKGYIVGVPATSVALHDGGLGGTVTRTLTASASASVSGPEVPDSIDNDFTENGCTGHFSGRRTTAPLQGSVTVTSYPPAESAEGSTSITVIKVRERCPH